MNLLIWRDREKQKQKQQTQQTDTIQMSKFLVIPRIERRSSRLEFKRKNSSMTIIQIGLKRKRERETIQQQIKTNQPQQKKHKKSTELKTKKKKQKKGKIKVSISSLRSFMTILGKNGNVVPNWSDFSIDKNSTWIELIRKLVQKKNDCRHSSFVISTQMNLPQKVGHSIGIDRGLEFDKKIIDSLGDISTLFLFETSCFTPMSCFSRLKMILHLKEKNALPIINAEDLKLKKRSGPLDDPSYMWDAKNVILVKDIDGIVKAYNKHTIDENREFERMDWKIRSAIWFLKDLVYNPRRLNIPILDIEKMSNPSGPIGSFRFVLEPINLL